MTGEIVSCMPPANAVLTMRWRCPCGVIWVFYQGIGGILAWRPDRWHLTRRKATKQHLQWHEAHKESLEIATTLTEADQAWLDSWSEV